MRSALTIPALIWVILAIAGSASAQIPPSPAELAAYSGLHAAAVRGDVSEIRHMAQKGTDLNSRDSNGRTPVHVAAFQGHGDAVRALIAAGADPHLLDNQRYDAVTIAAVRDDVATLRSLLEAGASAKLTTSIYDGTALIAAAHLGHDEAVRLLIRAGAPLDHINNLGWTALIEAVVLGNGGPRHMETVRALLEAGADSKIADRNGITPIQHARERGYTRMVALIEAAQKRP